MPAPGHPMGGPTKESKRRNENYWREQADALATEVGALKCELAMLRRHVAVSRHVISMDGISITLNGETAPDVIEFRCGDGALIRVETKT